MATRARKAKRQNRRLYTAVGFATRKQKARMRLRDGGCPPCKNGVYYEQNGVIVAAPRY